jgi:hypothetical protein
MLYDLAKAQLADARQHLAAYRTKSALDAARNGLAILSRIDATSQPDYWQLATALREIALDRAPRPQQLALDLDAQASLF